MRLLAGLLSLAFLLSTVDFVPARGFLNPKTCCGRAVCLCSHAKGAVCPFKHQRRPEQKTDDRAAGFKTAPCHTDSPKTILPQYSKDFQLPGLESAPVPHSSSRVHLYFLISSGLLADLRIDRPPRFLSPSV